MKDKKKIIIVENDESWSRLLERILTKSKLKNILNIISFSSYEDASEWLIQTEDYDLAIIDLELSVGNRAGLKFGKSLKPPIIIVSGDSDTAKLWKDSDEKVIEFFDKGNFDPLEFVSFIENIFTNSKKTTLRKKKLPIDSQIIIKDSKEITIVQGHINYHNTQPREFNKIINLLNSKLKGFLSSYNAEIKSDVNLIMNELENNLILYEDILKNFEADTQTLKNENSIIKYYLNEIDTANNTNNKSILENKLKLSISIIPGLLKLEPGMDLTACLKNLSKKYDDISFKILEKWSEFYFSLLERIKGNKII